MSSPVRAIFLAGHTGQVNKLDVSCQHGHQIGLQKQKGGLDLAKMCVASRMFTFIYGHINYRAINAMCHCSVILGKRHWINK